MEDRDRYFMGMALLEAKQSLDEMILPVGAVLVIGNEVIARGRKTKRDDPRLDHAEICALRSRGRERKWATEITLYTTLEPCIMCFGTALNCRVGKIVFAMEDRFGGITNFPPIILPVRHQNEPVPIITSGLMREESRKLLRQYFDKTDEKFWQNRENPLVQDCFL